MTVADGVYVKKRTAVKSPCDSSPRIINVGVRAVTMRKLRRKAVAQAVRERENVINHRAQLGEADAFLKLSS